MRIKYLCCIRPSRAIDVVYCIDLFLAIAIAFISLMDFLKFDKPEYKGVLTRSLWLQIFILFFLTYTMILIVFTLLLKVRVLNEFPNGSVAKLLIWGFFS